MLKRDTNVYLQSETGAVYKLPVYSDLSFSQVYTEEKLEKKTLHNPENLIASGFTSSLNPGNFNFTIPLIDTVIARALADVLMDLRPQVLYFENEGLVFRLNNCIVQSIVFNFSKEAISTITVSGSYSIGQTSSVPAGALLVGTMYTYIQELSINIASVGITGITSLNIEVANTVTWLQNQTMHDSAPIARANFVIPERVISATVVANQNMSLPSYNDEANTIITINSNLSNFLIFNLNPSIVTTRNQLDDVIKTGYDIRAKNFSLIYKGENIT